MKVVHLNKDASTDNWKAEAQELEKIIKAHPTNDRAYNRLMVIYRKQKEYKKELTIINKAIKAFEEAVKKRKPDFNKKVTSISKALLKATGLADEKGKNLHEPGEIGKWKKRKAVVLKKMK